MGVSSEQPGNRGVGAGGARAEERFWTLLESAPDAVVIVDSQGKIAIVNRQTEALFGYSREELLGQPVEMLIPARQRALHVAHRGEYAENPRVRPMGAGLDLRAIRKDGTEFPVEISLSPVESSAGLQVFSTIRDVTHSKRIEEELRQAKSELEARVQERTAELARAIQDLTTEIEQHMLAEQELARERDRAKSYLDVAEVMMLALDSAGHITLINRKGLGILGYDEKELLGQDWFVTCLPERHRDEARRRFSRILAGGSAEYFELPIVTKGGEERLIAWHNTALRDTAGDLLGTLSSGEDITERRRAEEAVKRLAAIVESSEDAIIGMTLDGAIVSWNGGAERLYGFSASEAIGQPIAMLAPRENAGEIDGILESINQGRGISRMETVLLTQDGRRVNVALSVSPVLDEKGKPIAAATIARDVTERTKLEQQLRKAHKMEAIGRLAGGIAHDFNNLLGVILGDSELLLSDKELDSKRRKAVEEIEEAGKRAASLTRQLLAFSRQQMIETQILNLNMVLTGFQNMLQRLMGPEIVLQLVLAPDLGAVRADTSQFLQVILNLAVNARDAMPEGGTLRIETSNTELDASYAATNPGIPPGRYAQILVADNGPGMDRETLAHIFEPFFTTKKTGQSSGMGLATAYGIIQQLGGSIGAYSEPGKGATFQIFLPLVDETGAPAEAPQTGEELPKGTETVLLVEDAGLLRRVTSEFLERAGYTVLAAEDGPGALALAQQHAGKIDLLLTDVAMPGMNGQELAERLLEARPDVKVLYTSGYADMVLVNRHLSGPDAPLIEKPFTWQDLAAKVRETLDRR